jgi:hypothetical protein
MLVALVLLGGAVRVDASPQTQATNLFEAFVLSARTDLELLANSVLGEGERPDLWTGNQDPSATNFVVDLWFDNEQMADELFGQGERPDNWFGATTANPQLLARNIRHDLEISAEIHFAPELGADERPDGWQGAARIYRCDQTLQNVVRLLDELYDVQPTVSQAVVNYCGAVLQEVNGQLLNTVYTTTGEESVQLPELVGAVRGDLERLADELMGLDNRPAGWTPRDIYLAGGPTLVADTRRDLETLADVELGNGIRPPAWIAAVSAETPVEYRNLRFNLEVLADATLGEGVRPRGWQGTNPLESCNTLDQALVYIVQQNYSFQIDESLLEVPNFCEQVAEDANFTAENPPRRIEAGDETISDDDIRYAGESNLAFAYLDVGALQYMGVMPAGTEFRAWYRNFNQSTMMFVSGQEFAVYIDRRFTTLPEEVFITLPTLEGVRPLTFCDAYWCNGPGPTPTPTGGGPLALLAGATTPLPTPITEPGTGEGGKVQVSWNHIRVTYLLDLAPTETQPGRAQVALEICADPSQVACEPVISVFNTQTGVPMPILSTFNNLNVYELPYGFRTEFVVEGPTRISPDIWISDPTLR